MAFVERVQVYIETKAEQAKQGFAAWKTSIAEADGVTGKLKAGVGGLKDMFVSAATSPAALAAGVAAVGAVAVKAIGEFQETTLAVGKFRDATGTTSEEASRLYEALGDLGIAPETVQGSFARLNKTIGESPDKLAQFGIEIARNADGTTDANETFLRTVDALNRMKDSGERSAAAQQLFGKSWQSMAEVIATGAPALRESLESVQPSKVFTDDDINAGRDLRSGFDAIKDAGEGLLLTIGKALAPVIADLAPKLGKIIEKVGPLAEAFGNTLATGIKIAGPLLDGLLSLLGPIFEGINKITDAIGSAVDSITGWADSIFGADEELEFLAGTITAAIAKQGDLEAATDDVADATEDAGDKAEYYRSRVEAATSDTEALRQKYRELTGELDDTEAWLDAEQAVDDYRAKIDAGGLSLREKQQALIDIKQKLLEYLSSLENVPPEKETEILALIEQGKIDEAEAALALLARPRTAPINPVTGGQMTVVPKYAKGTADHPGGPAIINDAGGELVELPSGTKVIPHDESMRRLAAAAAGGRTFLVDQSTTIINVGPGQTAGDVARLSRRNTRRNGTAEGWGLR